MRLAVLFLCFVAFCAEAAGSCESFVDPKKRSVVDLAPPAGFVDICSRDGLVCEMFTAGEPPNVREKIIGYFVPADQWERFRKGAPMGFSPYLIAQRAETLSPKEFVELKGYAKKKKGNIWENANLHEAQKPLTLIPMGVVQETEDLISVGAVTRHMAPNKEAFEIGRFMTPAEKDLAKKSGKVLEVKVTLTSVHTVFQLKGETLFLNTYEQREQPFDGESTKELARRWIECVREKSKN